MTWISARIRAIVYIAGPDAKPESIPMTGRYLQPIILIPADALLFQSPETGYVNFRSESVGGTIVYELTEKMDEFVKRFSGRIDGGAPS
jgi:hypothetical protein